MTLDRIMLIISILMVLGSFIWAVRDLRRMSRQCRREHEAWMEEMRKEIRRDQS